jgi:hypothetical protein
MGVAADRQGDRQGDRQWEKSLRYTAGAIEKHYGEIYHEKPRITGMPVCLMLAAAKPAR